MATPGKRRKRYLDADQPYLIPVSTLRFQKTLVGQGANAGTSVVTEPLDGDEGRENGGYRSDPLGTDEDDIQDCHGAYRDDPVDTDEDDAEDCHGAYRDDPVDTDEDDAQDCHGVDVGDVSTDSEHASQDQPDDGGDSTDDEHPDGEVSREKSLEEAVISEDDDDEEMGPGSIEDLLTLCVEEFGASMLPHSPTSKAGAIAMVISYAVSERSTWAGLGKLLTLVNALFGSAVLPTSIYKLRKLWTKKKENLVKYHYLCPCCDTVLNSSDSIARCDVCNFEESTEKLRHGGSYFLMLDLHKQLKHLIGKTSVELHHSLSMLALNDSDLITDITTAEACKHLRQELALGPSDLTITFNTDGSPIFKSSKTSVWPIQFTVNELPPAVRLHHPTLAGLWFGKRHPDMSVFLTKFVEEVNTMAPVTWIHGDQQLTSKAFVLCCSVDTPARAAVQNMVSFNGFFGCPYCLMKGEHEEGCVRYVADEAPIPRTSELVVRDMELAQRLGSPVNGIKGPSPLMNLEGFDLVAGMSVEYMHCVLQGVVRQVTELLFSSTSSRQAYYIGTRASVVKVDKRLRSIKPPHCITRLPRSIEERGFWKASEWKQWLLFYALPCLLDVLPQLYWKHLSKLCEAVHILLHDSLTLRDIKRAEELLNAFVCRVEALYGIGAMTFNMHLLLHLAGCVRHLGPLWAHSAFVFEGGNGTLVNLVSAAKGLPQQVVERVVMAQELELLLASHHLPNRVEKICHGFLGYMPIQNASHVEEATMLGCGRAASVTTDEKVALEQHCRASINCMTEYERCVVNHQVYHSTAYTRATKSDTTFVCTYDHSYFRILKILELKSSSGTHCILLCRSVVLRQSQYLPEHIKECFLSEVDTVSCIEPANLKSSCVYVDFPTDSKSFICDLPNTIERD
ncbi:uncharacterized protein LOC121837608 [Ixodes scapularis]|uniref:uncharacterized protein LOC121837608 n=2 Tax=Ixodes scapularis TaxID=6945 RepID=UPI001C394CF9|nr:uncharacterized protein LOC121837608 [Ixodes scapularis]